MSEDKREKEYLKARLGVFDKIPYEISKNLSAESLANMSIEELEQLNLKKEDKNNGRKSRS